MSHRQASGVLWAARREAGPFTTSRSRGAKAAGRRFEKALGEALPSRFAQGVWWEFCDRNGKGWCQTDWFAPAEGGAPPVVVECKYSWVSEGHSQMEQLYFPVIEAALGVRPIGIVACHRLVPGMPKGVVVCGTFGEARALALAGHRPVLHWLGRVPSPRIRGNKPRVVKSRPWAVRAQDKLPLIV